MIIFIRVPATLQAPKTAVFFFIILIHFQLFLSFFIPTSFPYPSTAETFIEIQ